jgi:hypothetical protein
VDGGKEEMHIKRAIKSSNKLQINFEISNEGINPSPPPPYQLQMDE